MEKQKLPNANFVLILGILSILTCCCWGIGIILGAITLVLAKKDIALYMENPELYEGYANINTGRVLAMIGITLSALFLIFAVYINTAYTEDELKDFQQNLMEKAKQQQEEQ